MATQTAKVCVVEDDAVMGAALRDRLTMEGFMVDWCQEAHQAYDIVLNNCCDILLCDILLPDMNGADLYHKLLKETLHVPPTVFITAHGSITNAVDLLKLGATDYITKPFDPKVLVDKLKSISSCLSHHARDRCSPQLGISSTMQMIEANLSKLAHYKETPLLITGESGVGKEVVAQFLHKLQSKHAPFVAINCSAVPESLIESELFGHEKGSFSGAIKIHKGVFEQANGGILFLDEIGDMPLFMQAKLLRVMQERSFKRIGGERDISVSLRVIFATNKDLEQMTQEGNFREDLYYRINVIHIHIPPLRERKQDIMWLSKLFLREHQNKYPDNNLSLDQSAKEALLSHNWPGNVRELKHSIERACILSSASTIRAQDLIPTSPERTFSTNNISLKEYLESLEKEKIHSVLLEYNWCMHQTADQLNISRKSLWEKIKKYGIKKQK